MKQINKERLANFAEEVLLSLLHVAQAPIVAFLGTPYKGCSPLLKRSPYPYFGYLRKAGYLKQTGKYFKLTKKGKREANYIKWKLKTIDRRTWDKKWRVLSFDVPEKKRRLREKLRWRLRNLNFIRLQDSVWVTPLHIENEINELIQVLEIKYFVRFMIVEKMNLDCDLQKKFFGSTKK